MRKALIFGINDYDHISPLHGCENDAISISEALKRHGDNSPNFDVKLITTNDSNKVTQSLMQEKIQELFTGRSEVALLYFAGHGFFNDSMDEGMICPQDFLSTNGVRISDILNWANSADHITNKIIILDSCQSGAAGQSRILRNGSSIIGEGVTILTACSKSEYAVEDGGTGHGLFTGLMIQALYGGAINILGQVTPGSIYSFIDNALGSWEQRPVFKTNVSKFISLRNSVPLIDPNTLRNLPTWFPEDSYIFPLDPSYEPDRQNIPEQYRHLPINEENTEIFKQLQQCNRHGLVIPHEAPHMYYAAIDSKGCKLTALGAYYRKLAKRGHI